MNIHRFDISKARFAGSEIANPPAEPVTFDGLAGMFHRAPGSTAVLLLSPWGYEELCSRQTFRILGERLAAASFPCLRYDYPATGNSLGDSAGIDDDRAWRVSVGRALKELLRLSDARRVIVMGQGVGGALAGELARDVDVDGLVFLAPVMQGRSYLREVTAWTGMTKPTFLVDATDGPAGGLMAGGFVLSAASTSEIRSLDLAKDWKPRAQEILLAARADHFGDAKLTGALEANGVPHDVIPFDNYSDYVSDPTLNAVPTSLIEGVVAWCIAKFGSERRTNPPDAPLPATLEDAAFKQTMIRFGPDRILFGALTEPTGKRAKTALLFLNSGYDHSIGWGRMNVDFARELARDGYITLRLDAAGIGESRLWPGQAAQVLFSELQKDDVRLAIDWLTEQMGVEKHVLVGRCSGAYLAGIAAEADPRASGAVIINARRLVWDHSDDVDKAIRAPLQTVDTYRRKMLDKQTLTRILNGELSVPASALKLGRALLRILDRKLAPVLRGASRHYRLDRIVQNRFAKLRDRGAHVELIHSNQDHGGHEAMTWFGQDLGRLSEYPNVVSTFLDQADHNVTPLEARRALLERLRAIAIRCGS
ncbi:MAG: alpha/beta fold hydrolase [Hyphomicrobiales bacterium]|nr:alpha/beta fold hydrolase [Hyphomicrobiales bacterium]